MIRHITLLCLAFLLLCGGCESPGEQTETTSSQTASVKITSPEPAAPQSGSTEAVIAETKEENEQAAVQTKAVLLVDPVELKRYEVPSQALIQWYQLRKKRPALLLYSNDPFLLYSSSSVEENLRETLAEADRQALRIDVPNPAILPKMTLRSALQAGLFSAVYWVMPISEGIEDFSLEVFRTQMVQLGAMSEEQARTLTLRDGVISGSLLGVPFHALHPQAKINISMPAAFHFDLSFLSPLYEGEIKTPIYPLIYSTLRHLREQQVITLSSSFSYSQLSGDIPLGSRFIGDVFVQLFKAPAKLDEKIPSAWQHRANALYLPELIINEDARKILLEQAEQHPEDASLQYALYSLSRKIRSARQDALKHLARAVQLDPVYALEYLYLAPIAREKGRPEEALRILRLAHEASPDNPYYTLEFARALIDVGLGSHAAPLLQELLALNWSSSFYRDMPQYLQELLTEAKSQGPAQG